MPVAVSDLERAADTYRRLGFVIKPGTPHANGIRNLHAKFADGTEIELITAPEGVDELTRKYRAHLAQGDGPAFLALHAIDRQAVARAVGDDHPARKYIFFGQLNKSPTDRPEHFEHPNSAASLAEVRLASPDFTSELDLFRRLQVPVRTEQPDFVADLEVPVVRVGGDKILMMPASYQRVKGRPIVGATIRVRDISRTIRALEAGGVPNRVIAIHGRHRVIVAPEHACGWQLVFTQ